MANSQLETFRSLHAIIELCKDQMHDDLVDGARGKKEQVLMDHRNKLRIDKIVDCTKKLVPLYEDRDKSFRNELERMRSRSYINEFYSKFTEIRRNHEQNPNIPIESDQISFGENVVQFSGEEWYGRFVDLHTFYEKYLNHSAFKSSSKILHKIDVHDPITNKMKTKSEIRKVGYKTFITRIFEFWRVENNKKKKQYIEFYEELLKYLVTFWKRTHPITPTKAILKKCEHVFHEEWKEKLIEGWQKPWSKKTKQKYQKSVNLLLDLKRKQMEKDKEKEKEKNTDSKKSDKMEEDQDEEDDDLNKNKNENETTEDVDIQMDDKQDIDDDDEDEDIDINLSVKYNHGLYCFSCIRKFHSSGTMMGHFNSKRHKAKKKIALLEYKVSLFADLLSDSVLGTVEYIEKKQTKTYDEIRTELEEAEKGDDDYDDYDDYRHYDSDDMEDDPSILNPLQIPLDFDGKPIPYWLYKFRGLNRYFDCEICDQRYRGPRAFERHFREWKHAHHMRMLNIPNTKDFHMITTRKDAELLHAKIQQSKSAQSWNPEREEEFEDNEGNVFKKSMYDQLKRQGVV